MKATTLFSLALTGLTSALVGGESAAAAPPGPSSSYAVVVSTATYSNTAWRAVVDALRAKHNPVVLTFTNRPDEALPMLREVFPRYACFVAQPAEASRDFVGAVQRLTRRFDDDPYADCCWGILTGYDASSALRIAKCDAPLTIRRVLAGTEIALDACEEGQWFSELKAGQWVRKEKGGKPTPQQGPSDSTGTLVRLLNDNQADLLVTSGHATERDWQMGYAYKNGSFRCEHGELYGLDTGSRKLPIHSANPKVFLPVGNCLMGHIDGQDAMALAFMNSGSVNQMIGYTVPTWYGYAGWGLLDCFVEQPGRFTLSEAFLANQHALIHRLATFFPDMIGTEVSANGRASGQPALSEAARNAGLRAQDGVGLAFDRDFFAFYGDPAWQARMADGPRMWEQKLEQQGERYTFEIIPNQGANTFKPVNINGSQRGGRPIIHFLPHRIANVRLIEGMDLNPVITDDFILVPNPGKCEAGAKYRVVFSANDAPKPAPGLN